MPAFPDGSPDEIAAALDPIPAGTPASEVARRLLDLFTGGSISPGTRLPPERQLAGTLGVGRSAVREALAALEILGIVDVRPGSGTYLRGAASELLPQTLRWGLLIGERNTRELLELRSGLEIYVARLAALHATPDDIAALTAHVGAMHRSAENLKEFARADHAFHHELARIARNDVLVDMLHVVRSLLQVYADRAVHDKPAAIRAAEEHEAVAQAVAAGEEDAAASAMATHMATAAARLTDEAHAPS